jgi:thiamine-phosphate pyrophosphorylase
VWLLQVIHHSFGVRIQLPRIYPITDTRISSLTHTQQVKRLIDGGATFIQLRDKTSSARAFYEDALHAFRIARSAGATMIINDRVDVAAALGADGVHLGQTDMPVPLAREILGADTIIGYSTHNLEQVKVALDLPTDYLAFGPVFQTRSKQNPDPAVGLENLAKVKSLAGSMPIVAIGGIGRSTVAAVVQAGADSAAIISDILSTPEKIAENIRELLLLVDDKQQR